MGKQMKLSVKTVCLVAGCFLIFAALALMVWSQISARIYAARLDDYLEQIAALTPPVQSSVLEERGDNRMPSLRIDGHDFVGILDFLGKGSFPVGGSWGKSDRFPCSYCGSIYDRSMVIGGTNQIGQITFAKELSVGDTVCFTDMTGSRFRYRITQILVTDHVDNSTLISEQDDLTVFVKNVFAMDYLVLRCNAE